MADTLTQDDPHEFAAYLREHNAVQTRKNRLVKLLDALTGRGA